MNEHGYAAAKKNAHTAPEPRLLGPRCPFAAGLLPAISLLLLVSALFALFVLPLQPTDASKGLMQSAQTITGEYMAGYAQSAAESEALYALRRAGQAIDPDVLHAARAAGLAGEAADDSSPELLAPAFIALHHDWGAAHFGLPASHRIRKTVNRKPVKVALDLSSLGIETDMSSMRIPVKSVLVSVPTSHPAANMARTWGAGEAQKQEKPVDVAQGKSLASAVKPISLSQAKQYKLSRIKYGMLPVTGALSALFESGLRGISAIGHDAYGGTSYGKYQISSRTGTMRRFIRFLQERVPRWAELLEESSPYDTGDRSGKAPETWKRIAKENPILFESLQDEFILKTLYRPALQIILEATSVNVGLLSPAAREVLWSTAVHHGPYGAANLFTESIRSMSVPETDSNFDWELIESIYASRESFFEDSSHPVKDALLSRLTRERNMALTLMKKPAGSMTAPDNPSIDSSGAASKG